MDRPLGVSGVINPQTATGGQDPQSVDDIRANAPLSVLTLGRAVSITDYQNFAASFAGIAKANAIWIPSGPDRGVFLTVAAVGRSGAAARQSDPHQSGAPLHAYGNPLIRDPRDSFLETLFSSPPTCLRPGLRCDRGQAADPPALHQTYSFAARSFGAGGIGRRGRGAHPGRPRRGRGQCHRLKSVATSTAGDLGSGGFSVSAFNNWMSQALDHAAAASLPRLADAHLPLSAGRPHPTALPQPAEILVLDPDPSKVMLGVMS